MSKISAYTVIEKDSLLELENAVEENIRIDWQPFGGIATREEQYENTREGGWNNLTWYTQAMVQYE